MIKQNNELEYQFDMGRKSAFREVFDKFDEYSCIKNDKWYLDYKEKVLGEQKDD